MTSVPKYTSKYPKESKATFPGILEENQIRKERKTNVASTQKAALEFPHQLISEKVK